MQHARQTIDIVMAGTFAAWRLGTLQARALPFARHLREFGIRAVIVTVPWDMPAEQGVVDSIDGIRVLNTRSARVSTFPAAVAEQARAIEFLRPKAIHVFKPKGFGGLTARRLCRTYPVVIDSDDWEGDGGWNQAGDYSVLQRRLFDWQERSLVRSAKAVTAASHLLARKAGTLRGSSESVTWVPNGLDPAWAHQLSSARFAAASRSFDRPTIIVYSRFAEFPADWLPRFVRRLRLTRSEPTTYRLLVVGDGTVVGSSDEVVQVEHMGYVAQARIPDLLGFSQLAVVPYEDSLISRSKNSVKLLELMAAGCAVVAPAVGDVPAVAGSAGHLLDTTHPEAFADACADLVHNPLEIRRLSEEAQARIRTTFTMPAMTGRLVQAYERAGVFVR